MKSAKKQSIWYLGFSAITSLIGLILAIMVTYTNPYIAFPWYLATLMAFFFSALGLYRLKSLKDPYTYGIIAIQHSWWVLSVGFAGVLFYTADYFMKVAGIESVVMSLLSAIWLFWGFYVVYIVHKETKAPVAP